ncbi:Ig-like domain-containing protein, partial [Frankia tisae]|uniref:Ig-like domain-containing protein n=2 Tax=Frankia tisae TaxID=2950104 RepID=UPI0021C1A980
YGGGSGSGGGDPGNFYGAGGGGGSGFAAPTVTDAALIAGVNHGDGRATVSFRYGASVALAAGTTTPLFGQTVTLTASVTAADPAAGAPGGTVTFLDGATTLATAPLSGGQAGVSISGLQPGTHAITASYGGDPAFAPGTTAGSTEVTVGFSQPCVTTTRTGPLTVSAGQSLCVGPGGRQVGPVTVRSGGALALTGATVTGPVTAEGALALTACQSTITGPVTVHATGGYVLLGADAADVTPCAGNTLRGPLTVDANTGGLEASTNTITGPVRIVGNSGSGPLPDDAVPEFRDNHVTGPLSCTGNQPTLAQTGNTVIGPRSGQCA